MRVLQKSLWSSPKSQKALFRCKNLVINTAKCDFFIKCVVRWPENSVRFEKSYGNWLPDGPNSEILSHSVRYGMYELLVSITRHLVHTFKGDSPMQEGISTNTQHCSEYLGVAPRKYYAKWPCLRCQIFSDPPHMV